MTGEYEMERKEYASKGVAGAGLGLGIAGTALGLLNGGWGLLNGNGYGRNAGNCDAGEGYHHAFGHGYGHGFGDGFGCGNFYGNGYGYGWGNGYGYNSRYGGCMTECEQEVIDLKSRLAKEEAERYTDLVGIDVYKAAVQMSNAEDAKIQANQKEVMSYIVDLAKEVALNKQANYYEGIILNNKIDCCCDKLKLADDAIMTYVQSNYVPSMKKLSIDQICPEPMMRYNSWTAPTTPAATTQA